jgi:hypothetical protein
MISPSSLLDDLGRARRVKAKPAGAGRCASLDTAVTAKKGGQLRGGRKGAGAESAHLILCILRLTHDHRAFGVSVA